MPSDAHVTTPIIKTHDSDEPSLGVVYCGICGKRVSRYTCPSCNILYCTLDCFRSELHSQCSERFYRKEIEVGIKSTPEGDRDKMLEFLRRIEADNSANDDGLSLQSDEEHEVDDITHRFSDIDVSSASADDLLRLLTAKERDAFFAALKDPSSGLVRKLLDSAELDKTRQLPWWEASTDRDESSVSRIPFGVTPEIMVIPTNLVNQISRGVSLLYNICAVILAYAHVTRHLSMSPLASATHDPEDQYEARRILSQCAPFLADPRSNLRHASLTDAVISFWSRVDPGNVENKTMCILLEDVAKILRPRRITISEPSSEEADVSTSLGENHPSATTIRMMSDMSALFGPTAGRRSHIVMKLTFYAAHILSTPLSHLHVVADQVNLLSKRIGKEGC